MLIQVRDLFNVQLTQRIENLRDGEPIAADVDVLFVVRPFELHPRAVFEIDQYVQRGGRLVVMIDQVAMNSRLWTGESRSTGMEALLRRYGAPVASQHCPAKSARTPAVLFGANEPIVGKKPVTPCFGNRAELSATQPGVGSW